MKIKILTFNILLHSFMLHSSEPKNFRKVTPPNVQRLWSNYREINSFENTNRKDIAAKDEHRAIHRDVISLIDLADNSQIVGESVFAGCRIEISDLGVEVEPQQ